MKRKTFAVICAVSSVIFILTGCSFMSPEVRSVKYHDLHYSGTERIKVNCRFSMRNFNNISPVRLNLLYAMKDSVMELDQYNYWVQSPEVMLRRYFMNAVEPSSDQKAKFFDISLTVFEFKFDVDKKESLLGIYLVLQDKELNRKFEKNYVIKVPVSNPDRIAFVTAINKCAEQFIIQAVNDIKKF